MLSPVKVGVKRDRGYAVGLIYLLWFFLVEFGLRELVESEICSNFVKNLKHDFARSNCNDSNQETT